MAEARIPPSVDAIDPVDPLDPLEAVDPLGPVLSTDDMQRRNLFKTLVGVFWMYGTRGVGLLWVLALAGRLSIADYGLYTVALAVANIILTVEYPWKVRAIRESEEDFARERVSRYIVGVVFMAAGAAMIPFNFVAFMALAYAGGEMVVNSYITRDARDGHPDRVFLWGAARQTASVALACIYLFSVDHPTLLNACLLYCVPYVAMIFIAGYAVRGHRPKVPGPVREMAVLMGELLFGTVLPLQGDVLVLGWLTDTTIVGYYALGGMVAAALCAVGQSFVMTYHEPLRNSGGDLSTGPKLRTTILLGVVIGIVTLLIGAGLLLIGPHFVHSPAPREIGLVMMIMAGFATTRTIICVFQVVLFAQQRDRLRFLAGVALIPFKFGLLVLFVWMGLGAVGAAIATTVSDAVALAIFAVALYRPRKAPAP